MSIALMSTLSTSAASLLYPYSRHRGTRPACPLWVNSGRGDRSSRKSWRKGSKNQLGLGHQSHEPSLFGFQSRLPNLCPASAMKGRSGGDHGRAFLGSTHEVRLALDCRSAIGACGKVYECGCTACRVSKRHRTAAMDGMAQGAKIRTHQHSRDDFVRLGVRERDSHQLGQWERTRVDNGRIIARRSPPRPGK